MDGPEREGLLLIADISGYTRFVGTAGAAHSYRAVARLLELLLKRLETLLTLSNIEGDALLLYADDPDAARAGGLQAVLVATFREFQRETRYIAEGADCDACAAVSGLSLKYVVHAGTFVEQDIAGHRVLYGPDVILAHRLLKNGIPAPHYIFATDAAARYLSLGEAAVPHAEVTDLGTVHGHYLAFSST